MSEEIDAKGVDVDEFFDGAEEGAAESQEVIEVGEENTEYIETETEEKPNVSITDLIDDSDVVEPEEKQHADGFVPVDKHLKLRERAQAAEARVEELESQTTRTDAENSGYEIEDDDYVTGKDMNNLAAKITANADAKAEARHKASNAKDLVKARTAKAKADQEVIAAEREDYYDVIGAMSRLQLSPGSIAEIKNADNSAEKAYEIGCQILNRKPTKKTNSTKASREINNYNNDAERVDNRTEEEQIFDDIYDS